MTPSPQPILRSAAREPLFVIALCIAIVWVIIPALINPGQPGDHFEQFTWAHSIEWGYHKHPPLPTFLLAVVIKLFGPSPYWAYALAAITLSGTATFTFLFARWLIGEHLAAMAMLLWGLHWAFNWKAQLYNHNTVMMLCIAAAAWLAVQATHRAPRKAWWAALGVAAGLALLTKYQSAIPLAGIILALWMSGMLKQRSHLIGLAIATVIALLIFAPHVAWVIHHDYSTLRYASTTVNQLSWLGRGEKLLSFSMLQLRMMATLLMCLGALALWNRWGRSRGLPAPATHRSSVSGASDRERRAWLLCLLAWPLFVLVAVCLTEGVRLQDHWGFQATQFISIWLAWQLRAMLQSPRRLLVLAIVAHSLALATYSRSVWEPATLAHRGRPDQFYPAQDLADTLMAQWREVTPCPLRFVVGPTYEAGMVSVYSGANPAVLEIGMHERSPWVDLSALHQAGAIYTYTQPPDEAPGPLPLHLQPFKLPGANTSLYDIYWTIVPPIDCALPARQDRPNTRAAPQPPAP